MKSEINEPAIIRDIRTTTLSEVISQDEQSDNSSGKNQDLGGQTVEDGQMDHMSGMDTSSFEKDIEDLNSQMGDEPEQDGQIADSPKMTQE